MKDGFVRVAAMTPALRVADVDYNVDACAVAVRTAKAQVVVLPELAITSYTCEDLFLQEVLLDAAEKGVARLAEETAGVDSLVLVGVPVRVAAKLYNCAAVLCHGELLGLVPKRNIPMYGEFYEGRRFCCGPTSVSMVRFAGCDEVPFGTEQLFECDTMPGLVVAAEICEDLWVPNPPSTDAVRAGATLVCNLSASNELVGKADYRRNLVASTSARLMCAYAYASAGWGESTQDVVYGGHCLVAENGRMLREAGPLNDIELIRAGEGHAAAGAAAVVDFGLLAAERRRMSTFSVEADALGYAISSFDLDVCEVSLDDRFVDPHPFVPADPSRREDRCESIFAIQAHGLAKRLAHTHSRRAVIGVSGGLDSTLALLVCARAFDLLGLDRSGILAITMPGFGTTDRTHGNATAMSRALGCELREVNIAAAVRQHFLDIGHDESDHSVTYENAQARERTQILMDVANREGGLVVGTGDLSELALGWATYNADHMSMYGVNAGVPKTLVRYLVQYEAEAAATAALHDVLLDILATPVSPELLPAKDGEIAQITEDLVGPYELHDFYLYYVLRCGFGPAKIYRLAKAAFAGRAEYTDAVLYKWLRNFYWRFFAQQFKRSCLPDGPKVGSVTLSPRGDWRMPSDACATLWLAELEQLKPGEQ